jgi:hypothetical protein
LASAIRKVSGRLVIFPIDGEIAAPDIAIAAISERSRERRLAENDSEPALPRGSEKAFSICSVGTAPTSGPPTALALKVKLVTRLPGGVAFESEMLAAAQISRVGHCSPSPPVSAVFEIGTSLS